MRNTNGSSLIEALVALALLELIAAFTLSATMQTTRTLRRVADAGATDIGRLMAIRQAAAAPGCRNASTPEIQSITLPATPHRAALSVQIRCGR